MNPRRQWPRLWALALTALVIAVVVAHGRRGDWPYVSGAGAGLVIAGLWWAAWKEVPPVNPRRRRIAR